MKKMLALVIVLVVILYSGCGQINTSKKDTVTAKNSDLTAQKEITVVAPKSPATIPVLKMVESNSMGENTKIKLQLYSDMEAMMAMAAKGDYEILIVPAHTAANLKNKGMDIKLINVFNWGGVYLSTTNTDCNSWKDLEGKEIYVPSKGSVPDILTQYFLKLNGLIIGENVKVVYSSHAEIAQLLSVGTIKYAIDAQPYVTSNIKNVEGYRVLSEFAEDWRLTQGEEYTMPANCMVTRTKYLKENEELINSFNKELSKAIKWTVENPTEAGALANSNLDANTELIATAMPDFCFEYKSVADSQNDIEQYYKILLELKPESIGGVLPDEEFYDYEQ